MNFDRSSDESNDVGKLNRLYEKLNNARKQRAIVCTTPEAVKSIMLKYIDFLQQVEAAPDMIRAPSGRIGSALATKASEKSKEYLQKIHMSDVLKKIILLWSKKEGGVALLDEVDLLLHPLKSELNFPIGEKTKLPLSPRRWGLPMHLLDAVFYGKTKRISVSDYKPNFGTLDLLQSIQKVLLQGEKEFAIQMNPHPILLSNHFYQTQLRSLMGEWSYVWLREQSEIKMGITHTTKTSKSGSSHAQSAFMRKVSVASQANQPNQEQEIKAQEHGNLRGSPASGTVSGGGALLRQSSGPAGPDGKGYDATAVDVHLLNYLSSSMKTTERMAAEEMVGHYFSPTAIQLLNLARDWIFTFLPHALSKVHRVSFGLLADNDRNRWKQQIIAAAGGDTTAADNFYIAKSRWSLAVPFIGKDVPSRAAEFAHPDVLLGLSILAFRYNGLRSSDVKLVVQELRMTMLNEPGPFSERSTRILFEEWKDLAYAQWNSHQLAKQTEHSSGSENTVYMIESPPELLPLELLQVDDPLQLRNVNVLLSLVPETVLFYLNHLVFPSVMDHRTTKLQASGVDLGSDMLFGTRLGFSGTPSDLLPRELRPCHYEQGSEAEIIRVLTSTDYVDCESIPSGWTVNSLLKNIAGSNSANNQYQALIDTGAIITGFSNEQVARLLLEYGLVGMDACVFVDGDDRRMLVDRNPNAPPVPLDRSGVRIEKRFTFYDQVHTTGMDIKQALDATAVVTLGKDMTLRDYSQGCW